MATFDRKFQSQAVDRVARLQTMADMPLTLGQNLSQQFQQGIMDSYGVGTVIRNASIPQGNTAPDMGGPVPNPVASLGRLAQNVGGMLRGDDDQASLSEDEYKASPYFREDIPFEQGMTADRAAALASFYDVKKVREYFGQKRPFSTFVGQMGGQALDPINYVPVFGQAAQSAAVARFGTIAGRALIGASDAAINTAAFGLLTSGLRDEFGDDTSWQAMTSEIAISALIGGAFGGVSGVIANAYSGARGRRDVRAEAAVANQLTDLSAVKEARATLNEAVGQMAQGQDINLSPNGVAAVERIQTVAASDGVAARALTEETANIRQGAKVAITPSGSRVEIVPEVVELDSLVNASGALQVRNRSTAASAAQVEQIATDLDPARLMTSVDADSGAPIVGADNVVDSGNGRVMAIRRAAEAYPGRYSAYKQALADAGFSTEGMRQPVLISRRATPLSGEARAKFNAEANAPRAAQMSAVELAAMDRNALEGTLDILEASPITSPANRAFVQRFLGNLAPSARGALVDGAGNLNADGARRVENALVATAYGDHDLAVVRRFAEATDDNTRAIVGAMADVAGKWAVMRQAVKRGDVSPEFDMTAELTEALRLIGRWREQASRESRPVSQVIREGMAQLDLLSGEISPETQALVSAFYQSNSFARAAGRDTIAQLLGRIVDAAEELGRPQLFGEPDVTRMEVLRNAAGNGERDLFTPSSVVEGFEGDGGFNRGASVAADREGRRPGVEQGRGRLTDEAIDAMVDEQIPAISSTDAVARLQDDPNYVALMADYERLTDQLGAGLRGDDPRPQLSGAEARPLMAEREAVEVEIKAKQEAAKASARENNLRRADLRIELEKQRTDDRQGLGQGNGEGGRAANNNGLTTPAIDGRPIRIRDMPMDENAPKAAEPATAQSSLLLNEPDNAAARVGRDDTMRDIALSHGVDPKTGGFVEAGDIAQLREEGRLTAADEAELAEADQMFADSEAFGRALQAAVSCLI